MKLQKINSSSLGDSISFLIQETFIIHDRKCSYTMKLLGASPSRISITPVGATMKHILRLSVVLNDESVDKATEPHANLQHHTVISGIGGKGSHSVVENFVFVYNSHATRRALSDGAAHFTIGLITTEIWRKTRISEGIPQFHRSSALPPPIFLF